MDLENQSAMNKAVLRVQQETGLLLSECQVQGFEHFKTIIPRKTKFTKKTARNFSLKTHI